jgi:hypothetical protein
MGVLESGTDFTLTKYAGLCQAVALGYPTLTVGEYLSSEKLPDRFAILRHDIDRIPGNALRTAAIEHKLGIRASYYFRSRKSVFKPDIIREISGMGHEIGYHYETLSDAKGDPQLAIRMFKENLEKFRAIADIRTVCMHGAPLSPYDNRDMWKYCDTKDFGLAGEAYLSMRDGLYYFSDTGRTWDMRGKMRDRLASARVVNVDTTDKLVELVKGGEIPHFYILSHPERWSANAPEWLFYTMKDLVFNTGKKGIMVVKH